MASLAERRIAAVSSYTVDFGPQRKPPITEPPKRTPRVAHLLAVAHSIELRVRTGELRDYAHVAREFGVTRARITQIMNLLLLAPEIQEAIASLPATNRNVITGRQLRTIAAEPDWNQQLNLWRKVYERCAVFQDTNGREVHLQDGAGSDPTA